MMAVILIFFFYALVSVSASTDVFGLVGSSVKMNVQDKQHKFYTFKWLLNKVIIVRHSKETIIHSNYINRVEFNETTQALILKDLQTNDSGLYQAKSEYEEEKIVTTYNLKVLEAVRKPNLNITYEQGSDFYNVTCSSGNISVTMDFHNATCNVKNETSPKDAHIVLSLYLNNGSIICNVSNPVSAKHTSNNIMQLNEFCSPKEITIPIIISFDSPLVIIIIIIVIIFIIFVVYVLVNKIKSAKQTPGTVYEEVQNKHATPANNTSLELEPGPHTVYVTVGKSTNSTSVLESNKQDETTLNSNIMEECTKPNTIYATVSKPGKAAA